MVPGKWAKHGSSFLVGRVNHIYMYPLTFTEFLKTKDTLMYEYVQSIDRIEPLSQIFFNCGKQGKSLIQYEKLFLSTCRIRYSMLNLRKDGNLLNIPLFLADKTKELLAMQTFP